MTPIDRRATDTAPGVLETLPADQRRRLAQFTQVREYEPGAAILREGDDTPFLGLIEFGRIALRLRVPELGDRVTIVTLEPGELVGWSAVVEPFRVTVDAVATERTNVLAIDALSLRQELAGDCRLAETLLPLVLESVSHRLTASWHQLLDMFATRTLEPW